MRVVILGVRVRGTHPLEFFGAKVAIFESFIDISSLNGHKNFGGQYPHPLGATSTLKFFLTPRSGDAYSYYGGHMRASMSDFGGMHRRSNASGADFDSGIPPPNLHTMVPGQACTLAVLKVKVEVKGHVKRAFSLCHKNHFFWRANCSITAKRSHEGRRLGLHPGCAQGHGQGQTSRDTGTFVM